jgi:hypothetical protein
VGALNTYITQCRRLLHDANGAMWPDAELTDYINEARNRVAQDTKCLRRVVTGLTLPSGQETYTPQTFIPTYGPLLVDVMGITIYINNTRIKLQYYAYTQFDAMMRYWVNYQQWPVAFSRVGATIIYVGPVPNQNYTSDWDIAVNPAPLVTDGDPETIPVPFTDPVKFWACYLAKFKEQSLGECQIYKNEYAVNLRMAVRSFMTRVIPNPYAR